MKTYMTLAIVLALSITASAEEGKGGYAGSFMQVPIGARPTAMGGAYIGVSDDAAGALFNPAGLAAVTKPLFGTSYRFLQLDRKLGYVTAVFPVRGNSILAAHWLYAGSGSIMSRDADGDPTGQEISQNNHMFSLLFAKRFENYLSIGGKGSYLTSSLAGMTAFTVAFDLGAMLYIDQLFDREKREGLSVQDMRIGLTISHLGSRYMWNSEKLVTELGGSMYAYEQEDIVPAQVGLGASAHLFKRKLLVATDLVGNTKQNPSVRAGLEFDLVPQLSLRGGYGDKRLTAGTGYTFAFGKKSLAIDYAFSTDRADEGSEHIFSFDLLF